MATIAGVFFKSPEQTVSPVTLYFEEILEKGVET